MIALSPLQALGTGDMISIDTAKILRHDHGMPVEEMVKLLALLTGWKSEITRLQERIAPYQCQNGPCLARDLVAGLDATLHDACLTSVIDSLGEQIDLALDPGDEAAEHRSDFFAALGVKTARR